MLAREGIITSVASVNRILTRRGYIKSRYGAPGKQHMTRSVRPKVVYPGDLVEIDTIHIANWKTRERTYIYTLIDLKTRWVYSEYSDTINPHISADFVLRTQSRAPFLFKTIQSDNGQEFSRNFESKLTENNIKQRRIRLGMKNDNAHIERFNRTIQEEALGRAIHLTNIKSKISKYIDFYNNERLHSGIGYKTPSEMLQSY